MQSIAVQAVRVVLSYLVLILAELLHALVCDAYGIGLRVAAVEGTLRAIKHNDTNAGATRVRARQRRSAIYPCSYERFLPILFSFSLLFTVGFAHELCCVCCGSLRPQSKYASGRNAQIRSLECTMIDRYQSIKKRANVTIQPDTRNKKRKKPNNNKSTYSEKK